MKRYVAVALAVLFVPMAAAGQDASTFADLRLLLNPGQTIIVTDPRGVSTKGKVETVSGSVLTMRTGKTLRIYPREDVLEVKQQFRDSTGDGARKGLLIGMALGLVAGIQATHSPNYVGESPGAPVGGAVSGALLGAFIGAIVDGSKQSNRTVYRAPGVSPARVRILPFVSEEQKGMVLNISF